jgi:hypothetical protein
LVACIERNRLARRDATIRAVDVTHTAVGEPDRSRATVRARLGENDGTDRKRACNPRPLRELDLVDEQIVL